jgi:hypothetical protein
MRHLLVLEKWSKSVRSWNIDRCKGLLDIWEKIGAAETYLGIMGLSTRELDASHSTPHSLVFSLNKGKSCDLHLSQAENRTNCTQVLEKYVQ